MENHVAVFGEKFAKIDVTGKIFAILARADYLDDVLEIWQTFGNHIICIHLANFVFAFAETEQGSVVWSEVLCAVSRNRQTLWW